MRNRAARLMNTMFKEVARLSGSRERGRFRMKQLPASLSVNRLVSPGQSGTQDCQYDVQRRNK